MTIPDTHQGRTDYRQEKAVDVAAVDQLITMVQVDAQTRDYLEQLGFKLFDNDGGGFRVELPPDWIVECHPGIDKLFRLQSDETRQHRGSVFVDSNNRKRLLLHPRYEARYIHGIDYKVRKQPCERTWYFTRGRRFIRGGLYDRQTDTVILLPSRYFYGERMQGSKEGRIAVTEDIKVWWCVAVTDEPDPTNPLLYWD